MAKIRNTAPRIFNLPERRKDGNEKGELFGTALSIAPGATLDVPDWYVADLKKEKNWANRIDDKGNITQTRRLGQIAPEDRERAERKAKQRASAAAQTGDTSALERRIAELESRLTHSSHETEGRRRGGGG